MMKLICDLCDGRLDPPHEFVQRCKRCGAEYIFDEGVVLCERWAVWKIKQLQALTEETER